MVVAWHFKFGNIPVRPGGVCYADLPFWLFRKLALVGSMDHLDAFGRDYLVENVAENENCHYGGADLIALRRQDVGHCKKSLCPDNVLILNYHDGLHNRLFC
jgi:hypothetical protein